MLLMDSEISFKLPFPSRRAAESLRDQVVHYLLEQSPDVGNRFPTEAELVNMTGLSRSTIRRGLELLRKEGWVQSRPGAGTVIGPKMSSISPGSHYAGKSGTLIPSSGKVVRLAVVVFEIGDFLSSWYWREVIAGIDEMAEQCRLSLELIGGFNGSLESIARRIERNRPDFIACMGAEPRHAFIVNLADSLNIPCAVVGTTAWDSGGIKLCEDNADIIKTALDHLISLGHRRIALTIGRHMHGWVFERHKAYYDVLRSHGFEIDEQLVHWLEYEFSPERNLPDLEQFIKRRKPTAVLAASFSAMDPLAILVRQQIVNVPAELSIVSIDQNQSTITMMSPIDLTRVEIPLREFGRRLAQLTALSARQEALPAKTFIRGQLHIGNSSAPVGRKSI